MKRRQCDDRPGSVYNRGAYILWLRLRIWNGHDSWWMTNSSASCDWPEMKDRVWIAKHVEVPVRSRKSAENAGIFVISKKHADDQSIWAYTYQILRRHLLKHRGIYQNLPIVLMLQYWAYRHICNSQCKSRRIWLVGFQPEKPPQFRGQRPRILS